jgi:2-methylcitrate dehydratase PrpD
MNETKDLAAWASRLKLKDVPQNVIDHSKALILDVLGCFFGGSIQETNKPAIKFVRSMGGHPEATVANYGDKTNAFNAAFLNASFGHGWDFDDLIYPGSSHTASACTAATFAVAERELTSGRDFLESWIAAYETANRVGWSTHPGMMDRGFHHPGTLGGFGAAAGAAHVLKLDDWKTENALAIAASQGGGTFQHSMTPGGAVKRNHMGFAASNGVRSAELAREGLTGAREAFEGKRGFVFCYAGEASDVGALSRELGSKWFTTDAQLKNYTCCTIQQGILDYFYKLKKEGLKVDDIERVDLTVGDMQMWMIGTILAENVTDNFAAQFSVRFAIGLAMVVGDNRIRGYDRHIPPAGKSKEISEVGKRVHVKYDKKIDAIQERDRNIGYAEILVKLKSGRTIDGHATWPKGFLENPMTKEERLDKFYSQALIVQTKEKSDKLVALVDDIENLDDLRPIAELLVR